MDERAKFLRKHLSKIHAKLKRAERQKVRKRFRYRCKHARRAANSRFVAWSDVEKLEEIYHNKPKEFTIDHIIPLHGELASGLHVHNNLTYMNPEENFEKGNTFIPYIEKEGIIVEYLNYG